MVKDQLSQVSLSPVALWVINGRLKLNEAYHWLPNIYPLLLSYFSCIQFTHNVYLCFQFRRFFFAKLIVSQCYIFITNNVRVTSYGKFMP